METAYYSLKTESLASCIEHCSFKGNGGWWYLPDIQRSFVWPAKATLQLIDSILRGWPFGILTVQKANAEDCTTIPSRRFLKEAGNCNEWSITYRKYNVEFNYDEDVDSESFYLVLDGQQRLQSILFAFAEGQHIGYVQTEEEWMRDLWGWKLRKVRNRDYQVCPLASMYIDFEKLIFALDKGDGNFSEIRYADDGVICYMISDKNYYTPYYDRDSEWKFPVRKKESGDACLRLNKLWKFLHDIDGKVSIPARATDKNVVREMLCTMWPDPTWGLDKNLLETNIEELVDFVLYLYSNVYKMGIGRVELEKPAEGVGDEAFQHDVVEIFTRLNHGGIPLTTGEITGAWLKNYWRGRKERPDVVIERLKTKCLENGFDLPDFIRFASALWAIAGDNFDQRKVIQNKDLTNANLLRHLAEWLSNNWKTISTATIDVAKDFSNKQWFTQTLGVSAYPLAVLVAFRMKINEYSKGLNEQDKSRFFHETLDKLCPLEFRFLTCSLWSRYWTLESIESWAKKWQAENHNIVELLKEILDGSISKMAINNFRATDAWNKGQVRGYYSYLLVWHHLNENRYEVWRSNIADGNLHVDHCVAYARWLHLLNLKEKELTVEQDKDYRKMINSIGNCILLNSSTNIGKGKETFRAYFDWLWNANEDKGRIALGITDSLGSPGVENIENVRSDIEKREKEIRRELEKFMRGETGL